MKRKHFISLKKNIYIFCITLISIVFIKPAYAYGGPGLDFNCINNSNRTFFASFFSKC